MEKIYMLHGFMGTGKLHFKEQISHFGKQYVVDAVDLPGHGENEYSSQEEYFKDTLEWLIQYLEANGEGYLIGLSLGASLAIHTAMEKPNLVKGIMLTGYSPFIPKELEGIMENQYNHFLNIDKNDKETASYFEAVHGSKWNKTLRTVLHSMTFKYPTVTNVGLSSLKVPTLLLNGDQEQHEVKATSYVKSENPNLNVGLIPNAGHTANIDKPALYNYIIEEFISGVK
ncbi:alpha/beta fold hydrolase [Bacillus hwajinpoensis]|uniref:Alpha/beta fold hydrolase n=1 Tax=Guptibacillus hwajinpoensis TaxID=208199 RepID=A0A845EY63_9BACL|nr:alpha/beta fold hydrolase [Pseudalkalibacillus hwajinpoensis]MYL63458.1 alpha/beta fold hydrolase [Pseudalkalibacillus hwajinpoensis]